MAMNRQIDEKIARLEPPKSIDAEQQVLGSILKDSEVLNTVIDFIAESDYFYAPKHQTIFKAMLSLYEKGDVCDITTVAEELTKMGRLDKIGGRLYLVELAEGVATTANIESHSKIILDRSTLRKLIGTSTKIVNSCYGLEHDVTELLDQAEANIFAISESRLRTGFVSLKEMMPTTFEQIEEYQDTKGGLVGLETGYHSLDAMTGGLHESNFIVIAARPSMGKTALALNIAEYVAIEKKVPVGIFSIEMSKEQLALRLLCGRARLSQHKLRTGRLKDSEWQQLSYAAGPLGEADIYIDDSGTLSALEMRAKARRLKAQHDVGLIIVDYIQMMHGSARAENRQQEMSLISRAFKSLSKELSIPIIAISQLSRMVEMRGGDKRPQLSDLRESGAIEQDADVVMFIFREEFYLSNLDRDDPKFIEAEGRAELNVAKQRNGPTGKMDLTFVKDYIRFENPAYDRRPPEIQDEESPF